MRRIPFAWVKYSLLIFLFALAACHKFDWDMWHKHNPDCRIEKIKLFESFGPDSNTGVFKYNHRGQPVSITFEHVGTGRPNLVFKYDHKGRLTEFIAPYTNQHYETWFKFQYDQNDRIISDSAFAFGTYIDSVPVPFPQFLPATNFYEYDHWGRISKVSRKDQYGVDVREYVYNGDGNLSAIKRSFNGFPGDETTYTTYDNKVSALRTNTVWMFMSRNYSKNNQVAADAYNSNGLPTRFRLPSYGIYSFVYATFLSRSDILYKCK